MGDGVLAYFGWPKAHEDEAERAVRAGLAIAEAVGRSGWHPTGSRGRALGSCAGLSWSATSWAGRGTGTGRRGRNPEPRGASAELARPGTVVVGEPTRRLIGGLFELEELPVAPRSRASPGHSGPSCWLSVLWERRKARCGPAKPSSAGRRQLLEVEQAAQQTPCWLGDNDPAGSGELPVDEPPGWAFRR